MPICSILMSLFGFDSSIDLHVGDVYRWRYTNTVSGMGANIISNVVKIKVMNEAPFNDSSGFSDGDFLTEILVFDSLNNVLCQSNGTLNRHTSAVYLGNTCNINFPDISDSRFMDHYSYSPGGNGLAEVLDSGKNIYHEYNSAFGLLNARFYSGFRSSLKEYYTWKRDTLCQLQDVGIVYYLESDSYRIGGTSVEFKLLSYNGTEFQTDVIRSRPNHINRIYFSNATRIFSPNGTAYSNSLPLHVKVGFSKFKISTLIIR